MKTQNLIKRKLSQPESVVVVQQILEDNAEAPRSAIVERVCEHFAFFNALGKPQKSGCLKALRELDRAGRFRLPEARRHAPKTDPDDLQSQSKNPGTRPQQPDEFKHFN